MDIVGIKHNKIAIDIDADDPICPNCNGPMWDNRVNKKNPKGPDFKCKDKACIVPGSKYVSGFYLDSDYVSGIPPEEVPVREQHVKATTNGTPDSMLMSYAKDITVAVINNATDNGNADLLAIKAMGIYHLILKNIKNG